MYMTYLFYMKKCIFLADRHTPALELSHQFAVCNVVKNLKHKYHVVYF